MSCPSPGSRPPALGNQESASCLRRSAPYGQVGYTESQLAVLCVSRLPPSTSLESVGCVGTSFRSSASCSSVVWMDHAGLSAHVLMGPGLFLSLGYCERKALDIKLLASVLLWTRAREILLGPCF